MRGKSHCCLGKYLAEKYMRDAALLRRRAFLMGCIQPDRNPATYLKGSIRSQWLRGHNFRNACRYMGRIASRLENKQYLTVLDYYTLGKLIHYTADAFTYAHNETFPAQLADHRAYENALQEYFLAFMEAPPEPEAVPSPTIMELIHRLHREYRTLPGGIHTDTRFAFHACCNIFPLLFSSASL